MLLALTVVPNLRADYASSVLAKNPLAYWRLNETTASPPLNTVANSSPLGSIVTGYVVGTANKGQAGIVGNCIRFNNPGVVIGNCDSKVDVPWNANLNPLPPLTIEFWAKPAALPATDVTGVCPVSSFNPNWYGGGNRSGWLFYVNNAGRWQFRLGATSGYAGICTATSGNAAVGVWQHIVATYDGTTAKLYVNGVQVGSVAAPLASWTRNPISFLRIGGTPLTGSATDAPLIAIAPPPTGIIGNSGNRGWDGWVDELAIYPTLLSSTTISAHYAAGSTSNPTYGTLILADNPVGYWNLNEPAVTPPSPATFPVAVNSGTLGAAADGTNTWGAVAAQPGSGYTGLGAGDNAVFFDGHNGHFQVNDAPGLHFSGNITMMAWIKPTEKDFFRNIIAHGWNDQRAETFLRISRGNTGGGNYAGDDNSTYYELGVTDGTSYDAVYLPMPAGDVGKWVFLAGTYDGAKWNLYRNGLLAATLASPNGALDVTNRWSIGSRSDPSVSAGLYFGGSIDEPAIFNTALTAADINGLYNAAQVPPVITEPLQLPTLVYKGSSASFSVWAEGSPTLGYSWTSNGVPLGVTTTNVTINNLAAGNLTITVVVNNPYGSATSSVTFPVAAAAPFITQQPQPITRYTGRPFTFSVTAAGTTPLSYQWKLNGSDIAGATTSSYSGTVNTASAGNYSVNVSNEVSQLSSTTNPLTALPIPSGYAATIISNSPVAYWRLGETNGPIAHDYYNGNDGTYSTTATLNQPGYSPIETDRAVAFSGLNSYVGNISGTAVNFTGHTNFSVEAWVNAPAGQIDEATIIAKGIGSSGTTRTEQFVLDVSGGVYRFFTTGGGNSQYEATAVTGPNGTWHHVVGVYDDASGSMFIYVNGLQEGSGTTRALGLNRTTSPVSIGSKRLGNDPNYDGTFNGTIDEVAVYKTALTGGDVQAHYAAAYGSSLAPAISVQPSPLTNYAGLSARFAVGAYGSFPLAYQWRKDGVDIPGATDASYTNASLALTDAGNYLVHISNANGSTNSAAVALVVLSAPTSPPAIPGLVLHLPFDGNLTDATGRGNNGTGMHATTTSVTPAAPTFVPDGALGQAYHYSSDMGSFPGPTTTNTFYVTLGVRPDLQFGSTTSFSVAYWIRLPVNYIGGDLPFFTDTPGSTFGSGFVFAPSYGGGATAANTGTSPGGWAASIYDTAGNGVGVYGDIGSINDGLWHHLVHVIDRTKGMVTYLDGSVANSTRQAGTTAAAAGNLDSTPPKAASIGQDPTGTYGETGTGDIDDLGVFRKALTPLEAASIYIAAVSNNLSYVNGSVTLSVQKVGNQVQLTWLSGTLQSADDVTGPYTDVTPTATSPYSVSPTATKKFYRLRL